ncbi:type II secretion system protein GspG [Botrimarina mediterranea]|uniref:type II secretion system protein GspG n=1 Tax=Botrimarina mediterranea TaxID=2528022 RepID=UPI0011A02AC2|nr:type II secretion system protein GspG [Botrimarina mediterranea]
MLGRDKSLVPGLGEEAIFPELSEWLEANQAGLNLLRSVVKCDRYYNPSPSLLSKPPHPLLNTNLCGVLAMRRAVMCLTVEAACHETVVGTANANVESIRKLAEFSLDDFSAISTLEGFRYLQAADRLELLTFQDATDGKDASKVVAMLQARADRPVMWAPQFTLDETLLMLDTVVREFSERPTPGKLRPEGDMHRRGDVHELWLEGFFDANQTLRVTVSYWNRLKEIASIPDSVARRVAYSNFVEDLRRIDHAALKAKSLQEGHAPAIANGEVVGAIFVANLFPDAGAVFDAADSTIARQRLTLLAAALKLHQLRHGEYPDALDALAPDPLAEIPLDPFTNEPFVYERRDEGFAIWSLGRNGVDDGGSDQSGEFVDGEYAPIDWTGERPKPNGPDDVVVRLPAPTLELPGAGR